jgi:SAM-dependent methyltransferase
MKPKVAKFMVGGVAASALIAGVLPSRGAQEDTNAAWAESTIPYVPTRHDAVRDLLQMAEAGTEDIVYDLGSGDGRVVIAAVRDFHVRKAVGVEIKPNLVRKSRDAAARARVAKRAEFIQSDLFSTDFSRASVVVLYLSHQANLDLRARLIRTLKPGSRIVSHRFGMGEWTPDKELSVRTPYFGMISQMGNEFTTNSDVPDFGSVTVTRARTHDALFEWIVPAPVAGVWRGTVQAGNERRELALNLHQRLSAITGSCQLAGVTSLPDSIEADLWGDHLRLHCWLRGPAGDFSAMWFDGHVRGDMLTGPIWLSLRNGICRSDLASRRDPVDFTGTWEWSGPFDSPVQLQLSRQEGRLTASYHQRITKAPPASPVELWTPVTDIYDCGGGFYFTLLVGQDPSIGGGGGQLGPEVGWMVGEAIAASNTLSGTIAFYPCPDIFKMARTHGSFPEWKTPAWQGRRDWQPKRVAP